MPCMLRYHYDGPTLSHIPKMENFLSLIFVTAPKIPLGLWNRTPSSTSPSGENIHLYPHGLSGLQQSISSNSPLRAPHHLPVQSLELTSVSTSLRVLLGCTLSFPVCVPSSQAVIQTHLLLRSSPHALDDHITCFI